MSDATILPALKVFEWSRPGSPAPTITAPISATATTLFWSSVPQDENGATIAGHFILAIRKPDGYSENIYVPDGAVAVDGLSATGCVRGIDLSGTDYNTDNSNGFAVAHQEGESIGCVVSPVGNNVIVAAIQGGIATGGNKFVGGDGTDTDFDIDVKIAAGDQKFLRLNNTTGKAQYSDDGTNFNNISDNAAGNLTLVSDNDTTAGYLNGKLVAGDNVTLTENNDGGNETLTVTSASQREGVTTHDVYTPGYMTGGSSAETNISLWDSVSDGSFRVTVDGSAINIDGIDFTAGGPLGIVTDMDEVAAAIQLELRAITGSTETVAWSTDHFIITSVDTTSSSEISVLTTSTGTVGTDISGVGDAWMDSETGQGTETAAVLDASADEGKVALLNSTGNFNDGFLGAVIPSGGYTAKGEIIAGTAADTPGLLTPGGDFRVLTTDSSESTGLKWASVGGALLDSETTPVTVSGGSTDEVTVYSYLVPANLLGTDNLIRARIYITEYDEGNDNNQDCTIRVKYGSTTLITSVAMSGATSSPKPNRRRAYVIEMYNFNSTSAQQAFLTSRYSDDDGGLAWGKDTDNDIGTAAEDSTGALTFSITMQYSSASFGGQVIVGKTLLEFEPVS